VGMLMETAAAVQEGRRLFLEAAVALGAAVTTMMVTAVMTAKSKTLLEALVAAEGSAATGAGHTKHLKQLRTA